MSDRNDYLLSIIIPTYNNAEFIISTLSSLQQGLTDEVEIIIINDGSTDNTDEKITTFYQSESCKNVKIIHQNNQGVAVARNRGLDIAAGTYIAFVDSDDTISPDYFTLLLPILREKLYGIVEFSLTRDEEKLHTSQHSSNEKIERSELILQDAQCLPLMPTFSAAQWHLVTKIFRRDLLGTDRFEANRRYEDIIFSPFQYFKCRKILKLKANLYYYRINSQSITENLRESDAQHIFFAMRKMCDYIKSNPEKRSVATLMIVNCFLEGRKIVRKKKGYYAYNAQMLHDIKTAIAYCDKSIINKKVLYKMKHPWVDTFISRTRHQLLKFCKKNTHKES
ncbi:glycosyltransferase [Enterobacter sp. Cy-643]|uniref:glycosyltransferase family 2 protein n=1 Tax=Enterobacter sp. Cy-643 TaxID=2608346 RepID=UPI00142139A1|nr:glycosyltransferase [Enterobacter sp. Cy-643]NIF34570.1 glycosyltransferase [Enterobacter sp. Cy-643]